MSEAIARAAIVAWREELQKLAEDQDLSVDAKTGLFRLIKISVLTSSAMDDALTKFQFQSVPFWGWDCRHGIVCDELAYSLSCKMRLQRSQQP